MRLNSCIDTVRRRGRSQEPAAVGEPGATTQTTVGELLAGALQDPAFAVEYEKQRLRRVLSEALFGLRKSLGLTQSTLAQRVGWRQPYVARLEGNPSEAAAAMERIEKFASACGASTLLLFVDKHTGVVKESVALGAQQSLQRIAAHMAEVPAAAIAEARPREPSALEEMKAVVAAAEQTQAAMGAATKRLRFQIETVEHEFHAQPTAARGA